MCVTETAAAAFFADTDSGDVATYLPGVVVGTTSFHLRATNAITAIISGPLPSPSSSRRKILSLHVKWIFALGFSFVCKGFFWHNGIGHNAFWVCELWRAFEHLFSQESKSP